MWMARDVGGAGDAGGVGGACMWVVSVCACPMRPPCTHIQVYAQPRVLLQVAQRPTPAARTCAHAIWCHQASNQPQSGTFQTHQGRADSALLARRVKGRVQPM